jgi:DNA gyrase subunit B
LKEEICLTRDYSKEIDVIESKLDRLYRLVEQLASGAGSGTGPITGIAAEIDAGEGTAGTRKETDFGATAGTIEGMLAGQNAGTRNIAGTLERLESAGGGGRVLDVFDAGGVVGKDMDGGTGELYYSGRYNGGGAAAVRWEPQTRSVAKLLDEEESSDRQAKVLAALGHRQRLDILRSVLREPMSGPQLVDKLNMGTTGQLYHHLKALLAADLLQQEERGGVYAVPPKRALPLLLLLAAAGDLADAASYLELAEARADAGAYLGTPPERHDAHALLWALLANAVLEHRGGTCSAIDIFLHGDGSVTVADNGRGIPVRALQGDGRPQAQAVLTELRRAEPFAAYWVPGAEKGISPAVVNALAKRVSVEIRRDGAVYRQDFKYGVPQTGLLQVGTTEETGTSLTVEPDPELFPQRLQRDVIEQRAAELQAAYPGLTVRVHG